MSTTFTLQSCSIEILNVTEYPSFILVTVDVSIDDVDDSANLRSSSIVILNFTVIHHSSLWLSIDDGRRHSYLRSWSICYPSSMIHHPTKWLSICRSTYVDDRWSMMLKSSPIVNTQILLLSIMVTVEKLIDDRGCKESSPKDDCRYMSIDDRRCWRCRRPTMIDLTNRIRDGRFFDLSQCTGPKNKILARQKIYGI